MAAFVIKEFLKVGAEFAGDFFVFDERREEGLGDLFFEEGGLLVQVDAEELVVANAVGGGEFGVGGDELERRDSGRGVVGARRRLFWEIECVHRRGNVCVSESVGAGVRIRVRIAAERDRKSSRGSI